MDEELQTSGHHITQSVYWLILRLIGLVFLFETIFVAVLVFSLWTLRQQQTLVLYILWGLQTLKFVLEATFITSLIVPWATTHYYLRDNSLVVYTGLVRRDEKTYDLNNLKGLVLRQLFWGKIFDYGDIELTLAASGFRADVRISGIYNPKRYERVLKARMMRSRT